MGWNHQSGFILRIAYNCCIIISSKRYQTSTICIMGWLWIFHWTHILSENTCFRLTQILAPWSWSATVGGCRSASLGSCDLDATFGGGWFWWWQVMQFWKKATLQGLVYAPSTVLYRMFQMFLEWIFHLMGGQFWNVWVWNMQILVPLILRCSHIQWRHINILGNCHKILIHKKYRKTWIIIGFSRRKHLYTIGSNSLRRNCGKNRRETKKPRGSSPTRFHFQKHHGRLPGTDGAPRQKSGAWRSRDAQLWLWSLVQFGAKQIWMEDKMNFHKGILKFSGKFVQEKQGEIRNPVSSSMMI